MLANLVKVAVPAPGTVDVGTVVALGAADTGFTTFHAAFGVGVPAFFYLSDGAGRTVIGVWVTGTGTGGTPVATVREIIWNTRTNSVAAETFSGACVAWSEVPAQRALPFDRISSDGGYYDGSYALTSTLLYIGAAGIAVPVGARRIRVDAQMSVAAADAPLSAAYLVPNVLAPDGVTLLGAGQATFALLSQTTTSGAPSSTFSAHANISLAAPAAAGTTVRFGVYKGGTGNCTLTRMLTQAEFTLE